jgi:hypothetical protein
MATQKPGFGLSPRMTAGELGVQIIELLLIAIPIASISWTITHEEVFREPREFCARCSREAPRLIERKFFYLFTCEYCFSHWVSLFFLLITGFRLIYADWRGYLLGLFALVWIANQYMSIFDRLRLDIKRERVQIRGEEHEIKQKVSASQDERRAA